MKTATSKPRNRQQTQRDLGGEVLAAARHLQAGRIAAFGNLDQIYTAVCGAGSVTIGQMHDAVRDLQVAGLVRLHPFTGARYQLLAFRSETAMMQSGEIVFYIEAL